MVQDIDDRSGGTRAGIPQLGPSVDAVLDAGGAPAAADPAAAVTRFRPLFQHFQEHHWLATAYA